MRPHGTHQQLERRRRRAIVMLKAGKPYRTVAATLSASLSSIVRWHQTYQKRGLRGLRPKLNAGRPCRLSEAQKEKLKRILLKGSQAAGYSTDLWTLKRVAEVIHKRFRIRYRSTHVWHVMSAGLKWRPHHGTNGSNARSSHRPSRPTIQRWRVVRPIPVRGNPG